MIDALIDNLASRPSTSLRVTRGLRVTAGVRVTAGLRLTQGGVDALIGNLGSLPFDFAQGDTGWR